MRLRLKYSFFGLICFAGAGCLAGCSRQLASRYEIPPKVQAASAGARDDSARFLDALSITDRVAQAYYLTPDNCPPESETLDCRTYRGSVEVCAINCWNRPVSFTITMEPRIGSFILIFDHGTGSFSSSESADLESEIVTRLTQRFGKVEKRESTDTKRTLPTRTL